VFSRSAPTAQASQVVPEALVGLIDRGGASPETSPRGFAVSERPVRCASWQPSSVSVMLTDEPRSTN
jgi:hypothetical protein